MLGELRLRFMEALGFSKFDPSNWDWFKYLEASKKTQEKYHREAVDKSESWVTCAVGQECKALPRYDGYTNAPADSKSRLLGLQFMQAIQGSDFEVALNLLHSIEKRTVELLSQIALEKRETN